MWKARFLIWLSENWKKNDDKDYVQTWYYMPRRKWFPWTRAALQFLCGLFGNHELSKTEWGYGGGDKADRWCRWCDKLIEVPKESLYFQFKDGAKKLMDGVGKTEG